MQSWLDSFSLKSLVLSTFVVSCCGSHTSQLTLCLAASLFSPLFHVTPVMSSLLFSPIKHLTSIIEQSVTSYGILYSHTKVSTICSPRGYDTLSSHTYMFLHRVLSSRQEHLLSSIHYLRATQFS